MIGEAIIKINLTLVGVDENEPLMSEEIFG
jgi:hypothetical protein